MSSVISSHAEPRKPGIIKRLTTWILARPTRRQRRATVDLRSASEALQRDIGLDRLTFTERRW